MSRYIPVLFPLISPLLLSSSTRSTLSGCDCELLTKSENMAERKGAWPVPGFRWFQFVSLLVAWCRFSLETYGGGGSSLGRWTATSSYGGGSMGCPISWTPLLMLYVTSRVLALGSLTPNEFRTKPGERLISDRNSPRLHRPFEAK